MSETQTTIAEVTDSTPDYLEYGDYRGFVLLDAGEWVRNLTDDEVMAMRGRRVGDAEGYGVCFEVADNTPVEAQTTTVAELNIVTGELLIATEHLSDAAFDAVSARNGGANPNRAELEPWGKSELHLDRADTAVRDLGFTRISRWVDEGDLRTASVRVSR
jgi:hypothetical protein